MNWGTNNDASKIQIQTFKAKELGLNTRKWSTDNSTDEQFKDDKDDWIQVVRERDTY